MFLWFCLSYISLEDVYSEEHWCFAGVSKNSSPVSTRPPLYYQSTGGQITILSWLISIGIVVVLVFLSSFPIIAELPSLLLLVFLVVNRYSVGLLVFFIELQLIHFIIYLFI